MKLFLAAPKGMEEGVAQHIADEIKAFLHNKPTVALAADEFKTHFAAAGGWKGWGEFVATGINSYTREPIYNAIVCVEPTLGKGTAEIVEKALAYKKKVFYWKGGTLLTVIDLKVLDSENWFGGWSLVYLH